MSVGFRKSLFGFNCDDVAAYIQKMHKSFAKKTDMLNEKAESLANELALSKEDYEKLMGEKAIVEEKLNAFNEKYEEIERLSENIGKLYLVAQANAQAIMANSKENAKLTNLEVEKNLSSIDEAHDSLNTLRDSIVKTSDDFVNEVNNLLKSLDETREKITQNTTTSEKAKEQFETVYESIVNN